jgi:hypothetical protein
VVGQGPPASPPPPSGSTAGASASFGDSAQPGVGACTVYDATNPGGGPVQTAPRINLVFWGSWDATTANNITATWQRLASLPAMYTRMAEYGIQQGSFGTRFNYPSGVTGARPDCTFAGGLSTILSNAHYVPTSNDVFIILLPSNTTSKYNVDFGFYGHHGSYGMVPLPGPVGWNYTTGSCTNNAGGRCSGETYNATNQTCTVNATHNTFQLKVNGVFYNLRYAIVEPAFVDVNVGISHEFAETVTDPDGTSFEEIGDPCEGPNQYDFNVFTNQIQGVTVQKAVVSGGVPVHRRERSGRVEHRRRADRPDGVPPLEPDVLAGRVSVLLQHLSGGVSRGPVHLGSRRRRLPGLRHVLQRVVGVRLHAAVVPAVQREHLLLGHDG